MARHRLDLIVVKPGNRPEHDVIRVILTFAVPPQAKLTRQILRGLTRQRWYRSAPALAGRSMTLGATADGRRAIIEVPAFRNSVPGKGEAGGLHAAVPISHRPPVCHITGFGDSSVDYILRFWITDPTGGLTNIRGNVYLALWDAFKAHGISIPFPQREVRVLNDSLAIDTGGGPGSDAVPERPSGADSDPSQVSGPTSSKGLGKGAP